jgi:hypothetical protein
MADISDVEDGFVATVSGLLYPLGSDQPSIVGVACRCYRGWPNNTTLSSDLSAGIVNLTVVPDNDSGRITTRFLQKLYTTPIAPGIQAVADTRSVTIGGRPTVGDLIGVLIDGVAYAYRVQAGDTPSLVASNLALAVQHGQMVHVNDCVLSIPGSHSIAVRCVADSSSFWEERRQEKDIRIIAWCPSPEVRDNLCSILDRSLAATAFLSLSDGTSARLQYKNTASYDQAQLSSLFRRDLIFTVEYATIGNLVQPAMLFGVAELNAITTLG